MLVGIEACGNSQWLIELLERLGHEIWIGDAAQIRASYVRKEKTDRRDAGAHTAIAAGGSVSTIMDADGGAAGSSPVADTSAQAGGDCLTEPSSLSSGTRST